MRTLGQFLTTVPLFSGLGLDDTDAFCNSKFREIKLLVFTIVIFYISTTFPPTDDLVLPDNIISMQ